MLLCMCSMLCCDWLPGRGELSLYSVEFVWKVSWFIAKCLLVEHCSTDVIEQCGCCVCSQLSERCYLAKWGKTHSMLESQRDSNQKVRDYIKGERELKTLLKRTEMQNVWQAAALWCCRETDQTERWERAWEGGRQSLRPIESLRGRLRLSQLNESRSVTQQGPTILDLCFVSRHMSG